MQALKCRLLYSAAGRGVRHDRPGTVVWGRAGRVLGVGLVLLGLVGCGLPGGGKQQPDWTGLAERLIAEAGTDARGPHPARREEPRLKLCAVAASLPMTGQQAEQQPEPHSGADQRADAHRPAGRQTDQNGDRDRHGNQQQGDAEQPP